MGEGDLYILGINAYDHDVSACLLRNGEIVVAIAKERISRVKHASGFYDDVAKYCLDCAGIALDRVDLVVRNCYMLPVPELERRLAHHHLPHQLSGHERERVARHPLFLSDSDKVVTCSHHLAHAYSAFAVSPFDEGAVMVVDGVGSHRADVLEEVPESDETHPLAREAESYYAFEGSDLTVVEKVWMGPHKGVLSDEFYVMPGLGALYSRVSTYIFGDWNKCGEVMGLAPYGRPGIEPLLRMEEGRLAVPDWGDELRHPFVGVKDEAWEGSPQRKEWEDLAFRVQEDLEQALIVRANRLHDRTGARHLCIAGGVGLNCVANGKLLEQTPFEDLFVQPAAGDDGIALGCACYGQLAVAKKPRTFVMKSAFLGREYDRFDIAEAFRPFASRLGSHRRREASEAQLVERTARLLAGGDVIGWFQGRAEFGPRALGNRSILADPRDAAMKDRVNAQVKHRQGFRPFAPVVIAERAAEYFEGDVESPFMLLAKKVTPKARAEVPAIVHVDGTARVQTVRREQNPRLYALLEAFDRMTGVPVLLNTSFNIRGDPIVEDPTDAMECFLFTKLDALVLHDWVIRKSFLHRIFSPLFRFLVRARRNLRSEAMMERFAERFLEG
ncbi:MAG: carbamoyltransferase family protein [Planctomycetota bacterium]|jgi:carbamoyltransferase